ncbi:hypothetical protein QYF36_004748 [Acer negundo]|nr:hypothetical protein QYF36_004748 [Acer negundo]
MVLGVAGANPVCSFLSLSGQGESLGWVLWLLIPLLSVGGLSSAAAGGLRLSSSIAVDSVSPSSSKEQKRGEGESVATVVALLSLSVGPKRAYRSILYSRSLIKKGLFPWPRCLYRSHKSLWCAGRQGRTRTGVQPERKTRIKERLKARLFAFLKRKADYARRGAQP